MMNGYKTWTGLIITLLGSLGIAQSFGNDQLTQLIDALFQLGGIVFAMYGNYKAHKKIKELQG